MKSESKIKTIFQNEAANPRFSMPNLYRNLTGFDMFAKALRNYGVVLGHKAANHVVKGIIRSVFLIELVQKPKIETTKFAVRWTEQLKSSDPRYANFEECIQILERVITHLDQVLEDTTNQKLLKLLEARKLIPYEIPLDYRESTTTNHIHHPNNIFWIFDDLTKRTVQLREVLMNEDNNPHAQLFHKVYNKKIKVKTE